MEAQKTTHENQRSTEIPVERKPTISEEAVSGSKEHDCIMRRMRDVLLAAIGLILLSPLLVLIALTVWLECPTVSPIYVQKRVGYKGMEFQFYKFRTMIPGAEEKLHQIIHLNEMDGPAFKMKNDPRITKVGKLLRKTSIDELPQLMNVLKGDMSIVGPRPALPREVTQYDAFARQRLYVKPGLTCLWQIQPNRNELSFDEWMALDLEYIQNRSLRMDWIIIFATVKAVFRMEGV